VIAYRATLDLPRDVHYLARLLTAERRALGTHTGTRTLTCHYQAILVLAWFRKGEDKTLLGTGFGVPGPRLPLPGRRDQGPVRPPDLQAALQRVADQAGRTSSWTASCSPPTGWPRPPAASKATRSTPGTPANTTTSAPTSKRSSAPTGYRSEPPTPRPDTCMI
jgi:hypothetical protein